MDAKLLRTMQYLYYSLFLVTPLLMFHRTSELFEFNKILYIYLISGIIVTLWLARMLLYKSIIIKNTLLSLPLLLFLASQVISTFFSIDQQTSLFGYYGRFNGGLLSIASYVALYLGFTSNFTGNMLQETVRKLLKYSLAGSVLVILWGLPSKFGYDLSCLVFTGSLDVGCWTEQFKPTIRVFSTLGQPNWLGAYLVVNYFIGLYFFLINIRRSKLLYLYSTYLSVNFAMLLFTRSRSALLAVLLGLLLYVVYFVVLYRSRLMQKRHRKPILLLASSLVIALLVAKTGIASVDRLISFSAGTESSISIETDTQTQKNKDLLITDSFTIRKIVWQGGYNLGLMYPLFGTGVETFAYSYNFVRPLAHNTTSEWDFVYNKAHNEFINYLATTGFVGLLLYAVFLAVVLSQLIHIFRFNRGLQYEERMLILASMAGFLSLSVTNFFGFSITVTNLYLYLLPACVVSVLFKSIFTTQHAAMAIDQQHKKRVMQFVYIASFIVVFYVARYFYADLSYAQGDNLATAQSYNSSLVQLYKAYNIRKEHIYADKISNVLAQVALMQASSTGEKDCVSHNNELSKCEELVEYYSDQAITGSPKNPIYYRTASRNAIMLYQATGNPGYFDKAIKAIQSARQLAPTDAHYPYTLALFYLAQYENTKKPTADDKQKLENLAVPAIDFAIKLKPNYRDALYAKVLILKHLNKRIEAKNVIDAYLNNENPNDEQFLQELKDL